MIKTGMFHVEIYEFDGSLIEAFSFPNGMTMQGLNASLDVELAGGAQVNPWFMGLIDNAGFTSININDTMTVHSGWTELTSYNEATREQLVFGSPAGGIINTPNFAEFTINASVAIQGVFIASTATKGLNSGILRAHGSFGAIQNRIAGQFMRVEYSAQNTAG